MILKDQILLSMPNNLNDLEKARYIYINLGKQVSFSTKFQNSNFSTYYKMLQEKVDINTFEGTEVNCIIWSQIYSQLLTCVGIENEIINIGHQYVVFKINNKNWVADVTFSLYCDLARIHNGDKTNNFGPAKFQEKKNDNSIELTKDTEDLLDEIDKKIGYYGDERKKLDELRLSCKKIKNGSISIQNICSTDNVNDILRLKLEYLFSKLGTLKNGYYESKDFVFELEYLLLNDQELKKVRAAELKRTNYNTTVDIIQCIYILGSDANYYLLAPNLPIKKVDKIDIARLAILGYCLDDLCIPGIDYPIRFNPNETPKSLKYTVDSMNGHFNY